MFQVAAKIQQREVANAQLKLGYQNAMEEEQTEYVERLKSLHDQASAAEYAHRFHTNGNTVVSAEHQRVAMQEYRVRQLNGSRWGVNVRSLSLRIAQT